jgi:predicted nucleic acid-binding protein
MMRPPVAVYDANVLYPAHLRDLLMRLAVSDLVRPHWSEEIHEEWMRNVHTDYPDVTWEDLKYTRREMDRALPDACAEGYRGLVEDLSLPDLGDRHILAVAIHVGADYIVTFNLGDFPERRLDPHGVEAVDPDELISLLTNRVPESVIEVAAQHRASLRKPPLSPDEYLQALRNGRMEKTADWLASRREDL